MNHPFAAAPDRTLYVQTVTISSAQPDLTLKFQIVLARHAWANQHNFGVK